MFDLCILGVGAMKTLALSLAVALAGSPASADRLSYMFGSSHVGAPDGMFCEVNPGLFYTVEGETIDVTFGNYSNSYCGRSTSVTASHDLIEGDGWAVGVWAGVSDYGDHVHLTGTQIGDTSFAFMGGLQARYDVTDGAGVFAQYIPMYGDPVKYVAAFGVTFDVDFF